MQQTRGIKVTYTNGESYETSVNANVPEAEIKAYFLGNDGLGRWVNAGDGPNDRMLMTKEVEFLVR
jgi:hypothetical protein